MISMEWEVLRNTWGGDGKGKKTEERRAHMQILSLVGLGSNHLAPTA